MVIGRTKLTQVPDFVAQVAALRFANAFNPYADLCAEHDLPNAPDLRKSNLTAVIEASIQKGVHSIWIGRDLGYRGGRRTGLPLTDEAHLRAQARLLGTPPLARSTRGPSVRERTAANVWRMLELISEPIFLWNVFPLHPHSADNQFSNRAHTRSERRACRPLLEWLLGCLQPQTVVAIGRDAEKALLELGIEATRVRHPSYGGQCEFVNGLEALYDATTAIDSQNPQASLI